MAVVTPSWGGPYAFPGIYRKGLEVLREDLGLEVVEARTTRYDQSYLRRHPEVRAMDINQVFEDDSVDAVISSIGGDDSVRILPFLDLDLILSRPKVLMGFSDTTTVLSYLNWKGLVTFYGPSVMAGIAQMRNYPRQVEHIRSVLFHPSEEMSYRPFPKYSEGYPDWAQEGRDGEVGAKRRNRGWRALQGDGRVRGRLFGGCIEVLEMMKATPYWPPPEFWKDKVLFLETSEEKPTPDSVKYMLRNYGMQGVFDSMSALLFGRPRGYTPREKVKLATAIRQVVGEEFGRPDMPIIADMDFGHTDPQLILPLGIRAEVDPDAPSVRLLEPAVR